MGDERVLVNGQHLVLLGISGNAGDRNAVASLTIPVRVSSLVEALSLALQDGAVSAALGISGLTCTDRPIEQDTDGGYIIRFVFEGFNEDVSLQSGEERCSYRFDADMQEAPIGTHPKYDKLSDEYGPVVDDRFPKFYLPKNTGSNAAAKGESKPRLNPFYQIESWLKAGGIFSRTYAVTTVPADVYRNIGTLIEFPPGAAVLNIPRFKNRKWLKMCPLVESGERGSGSAARVTEKYRLTGVTNGSEAILYDRAQLED